jgi:hypothetical protein
MAIRAIKKGTLGLFNVQEWDTRRHEDAKVC